MRTREPKRKTVVSGDPGTWAEIFAALDAAGVRDGFVVERDMRPAEERPALDAFFSADQH